MSSRAEGAAHSPRAGQVLVTFLLTLIVFTYLYLIIELVRSKFRAQDCRPPASVAWGPPPPPFR